MAVAVSGESVLAGWRPVEGGHGPGRRHAPTLPAIWSIHRRIHSLAAGPPGTQLMLWCLVFILFILLLVTLPHISQSKGLRHKQIMRSRGTRSWII